MNFSRRIAVISLHTCPWQTPGTSDSGGMNVYIRETAVILSNRGWSVDIFTRTHNGSYYCATEPHPGIRLIHVPAGPINAPKDKLHQWVPTFVLNILKLLRRTRLKYRGVVSNYWLSGLASIELATKLEVPHIAGFHTLSLVKQLAFPTEPASSTRVAGEHRVIDHADHMLATSNHEKYSLNRIYGARFNRISIASPGVDRHLFYPRSQTESRRRLGISQQSQVVLAVGRSTPLKGFDVLLRAVAAHSNRNVSVLLVGGEIRTSIQDFAHRLGIERRVHFAGSVPHSVMPTYFAASDVCVVPSFYESFGLVALEAIACGRPVIASRVGGLTAIIHKSINGHLVSPGSVSELKIALTSIFTRTESRLHDFGHTEPVLQSWSATTDSILSALAKVA